MKRIMATLAAAALAGSIVSCGGEKITGQGANVANKANNFYAKERFSQATDVYREFVELNPDSPYRRAALIGLADSSYKDKDYFTAILYYERFLELYPIDALTPRALFYLGMSYYNDTHTPDRDQTPTSQARDMFKLFLERFPDHPLAPFAIKYKAQMEALMTQSEMEIVRFYVRTDQNHAAIVRLKEYIKAHPDSAALPEAIFLLGESYYKEQSFKKAAIAFTNVIKKYPDSEFTPQATLLAQKLKLSR